MSVIIANKPEIMKVKYGYFFLPLLLFSSCLKEGACEFRTEYNNVTYHCWQDETQSVCNASSSGISNTIWHEGRSCQELGYTYQSQTTDYSYSADDADGTTPGANGGFVNSGGSGGANCGSGGYNGPDFDIQIDAQCKAAYQYKCAGNQQGVDYCCAIYNSYENVPPCPYCN